ncbi:MAG TPA: hypothetical protein DDY13_09095 [Cytophagales bacterium]|nr:hypothetical protein [Cytophagales bacterium]
MHIDTLYVDKFLKSEALGLPDNDTGKKGKSSVMPKKIFIPKSQLKLNTTADRLYYQNGSVDQLQLEIVYGEDVIDIKQLDFFFADGHISTKGKVFNSDEHAYQAFINSTVEVVDIQKALLSFNEFNQAVFNSDNSRGKLSWDSQLFLTLNHSFFPITRDNLWKFEISLHEGEFKKIEPIEKALFFVGHKAKDDLVVSELDIDAYLYDGKVLFRDVFMNDNIADLDLFGEVDIIDSLIDIGMEISLTDLLLESKKERMAETKAKESHLDSDMKVFLKMQGPLAEHKLKLSSGRKFKKSRSDLDKLINQAEASLEARKNQKQ